MLKAPADTAGLAFAMRPKVVLLDAQWTHHTFDMGFSMQYVLAGSNIKHLDVVWGGGLVHACMQKSHNGSGHGSAGSCYSQPFAGRGVLALSWPAAQTWQVLHWFASCTVPIMVACCVGHQWLGSVGQQ